MLIEELRAKTIVTKSGLPDSDYTVNPYTGCAFGCQYCYAAFMRKWHHPEIEWGDYVGAKINAPELLRKELKKLSGTESIFFSSVTDCYQPAESKYQLTRKCLQVIAEENFAGPISILTKSPLCLRDIEIFKKIKDFEIGMTVTTTEDQLGTLIEKFAPPSDSRITTLKKLKLAGLKTYAFVGPLLPHFASDVKNLEKLYKKLEAAGVDYIYLEHINLSPYIKKMLFDFVERKAPQLMDGLKRAETENYKRDLEKNIKEILTRTKLVVKNSEVIEHGKFVGRKV